MNPLRSVAILLLTLGLAFSAHARDLSVDESELVQVEIATLGVAGMGAPVVLLREPDAREVIPIIIGPTEAESIMRAMQEVQAPRPLTHDLFGNVFEALDARLVRVIVDDLVDDTFLGILELEVEGREDVVRIDTRPSDGMALAIRAGATLHVTPAVMEASQHIDYEGLDNQVVTALGITVGRITDDLRTALDLPDEPGVLVTGVTGPAAEAGMEPGALILRVNGEVPETPMEYLESVRDTPEDADAAIRYWQAGEVFDIEVPTDVPDPRPRIPAGEGIEL
jgi:uncharacterized protein